MFSYYPRQSYYQPSPFYQPSSPYARAVAEQQQRARAMEMERQRAARSRYFPYGYDYESDEEDYLTPRQKALFEARKRQEALEQRKQDAARLFHERAMKQQQAREETERHPQPIRRSASPSQHSESQPAHHPAPQPTSPAPSRELLNEAATKIQTQYRIHRSLLTISELASKFDSLKASFVPPTTIDYQGADGIVSVPVVAKSSPAPAENAKLAFTPMNVPLHTYTELLSRLLVALDAVESRGDRRVRERRRSVVRTIEAEAARLEEFWRSVWAAHQQEQQQQYAEKEEEEVCDMVVETEEAGDGDAPSPVPELAIDESDSDVEPEFATPPATPARSPEVVLLPESDPEDDGVVVDVIAGKDKVSGEDFVIV
ncbi:hypothetical protein C8R43DRAFT_1002349 [Mycena crocata]|nr:hypothetical protein C8R43DRAFT_1002349 [Mycena crocata]